jgi:putative FmdB family regulatory protein
LPTYEYACTACGHRLDAVQKFTDEALTACPECGGALRKVFGAVGIVLKGSGFYKTDTRAQDKRSGSDSAGSNGSDSSKSETKVDTGSTEAPKGGAGGDKPAKESSPAASPTS